MNISLPLEFGWRRRSSSYRKCDFCQLFLLSQSAFNLYCSAANKVVKWFESFRNPCAKVSLEACREFGPISAHWVWSGDESYGRTTVSGTKGTIQQAFDSNFDTIWHSAHHEGMFQNFLLKRSFKPFETFGKAPWFNVKFRLARPICFIRIRRRRDWNLRYNRMTLALFRNGQLVQDWVTKSDNGGPYNEAGYSTVEFFPKL